MIYRSRDQMNGYPRVRRIFFYFSQIPSPISNGLYGHPSEMKYSQAFGFHHRVIKYLPCKCTNTANPFTSPASASISPPSLHLPSSY